MKKPHYLRKKRTGPPGPRKEHGVKTKRRKKPPARTGTKPAGTTEGGAGPLPESQNG